MPRVLPPLHRFARPSGGGLIRRPAITAALLASAAIVTTACSAKPPATLGLHGGRLAACPSSPTCVSSQADPGDGLHFVEPLRFQGDLGAAKAALELAVAAHSRARFTERAERYWRIEFASALFRFVDDVELVFGTGPGRIDVRTASRTGYSDFGVNRKRVEALRGALR